MIYPVPKPHREPKAPPKRIRVTGRRRFPGREDPDALDAIRRMPCLPCLILGMKQLSPTEPEHWVTKARGGYDNRDVFPTCAEHRTARHTLGDKSFAALLGIDPKVLTRIVAAALEACWGVE